MEVSKRCCAIDDQQLELPFDPPLPACEVPPCPDDLFDPMPPVCLMPPLPPEAQALVDRWKDMA